ncbi:MAG: hypothetical protein WBV18_06830, partial [Methyloceanibacter sp.]|uniref:hypothetical protein n=1 Tax=Methyloceanibacter sp. TaxID=1965321 RepID=UPI003C5DCC06
MNVLAVTGAFSPDGSVSDRVGSQDTTGCRAGLYDGFSDWLFAGKRDFAAAVADGHARITQDIVSHLAHVFVIFDGLIGVHVKTSSVNIFAILLG